MQLAFWFVDTMHVRGGIIQGNVWCTDDRWHHTIPEGNQTELHESAEEHVVLRN